MSTSASPQRLARRQRCPARPPKFRNSRTSAQCLKTAEGRGGAHGTRKRTLAIGSRLRSPARRARLGVSPSVISRSCPHVVRLEVAEPLLEAAPGPSPGGLSQTRMWELLVLQKKSLTLVGRLDFVTIQWRSGRSWRLGNLTSDPYSGLCGAGSGFHNWLLVSSLGVTREFKV